MVRMPSDYMMTLDKLFTYGAVEVEGVWAGSPILTGVRLG